MDSKLIFGTLFILSLSFGFVLASPEVNTDRVFNSLEGFHEFKAQESSKDLKLGTDHGHAMFFVSLNNSLLDFTGTEFQLNSRYVHLENNNSHIVHKHAEGVTWKKFLDTVNITLDREEELCVKVVQNISCGKGKVMLNGEEADLSSEIEQDDRLAIVLGSNVSETLLRLKQYDLPERYKPEPIGRSV